MESRRKLGSVSNGLLACTWHHLGLSFPRGIGPKAGLEVLSPAFPDLAVRNRLWGSRAAYWLWAEQLGDPFPVLLGVSSALRTRPPGILHALVRGLPPAVERPEQSMLPAKTKGRKSASEPGVACPRCLEYLWFSSVVGTESD